MATYEPLGTNKPKTYKKYKKNEEKGIKAHTQKTTNQKEKKSIERRTTKITKKQ